MPRRAVAFVAFASVCVIAAVVSGAMAVTNARSERAASDRAVAKARPVASQILAGKQPFVVLRDVDPKHAATFGRLSLAQLVDGKPGRAVAAGPSCDRVAFAAGRGICLDLLGTTMGVHILDANLRETAEFDLPGIPSRTRISPSGRWGGTTAFVVGHAYALPGQFSTAATIIDLRSGKPVADLEKDFTVTKDGKTFKPSDRNFWGLTFAADDDTFYATMASGQQTWLIKGSIQGRTAQTIHSNVECPSLSPDGTRIGYKQAVSHSPSKWRFHVLDLATGRETALSETRSVDDQLAWADDQHLIYSDKRSTWMVNADGSGKPMRWLADADSPTVQVGELAAP